MDDLLAKKICMQYRISCPWAFKNIKKRATAFVCIKAQCPECNALYCTLIEKVTKGKDVIFKCAIKNALKLILNRLNR